MFTFVHKGQPIQIVAKSKGESISVVNSIVDGKLIKSIVSAYMVFVKENTVDSEVVINIVENQKLQFLNQFKDCFSDALLGQLPPERPEDHAIELMPGSEPPNRRPYRVSAA